MAVATDAPPKTKPVESEEAWRCYGLKWGVHKFGGASLNDAGLYKTCGDLLLAESKNNAVNGQNVPTAAIVSAAGGMTDMLVSIINTSLVSVEESCEKLKATADRQKSILLELVPDHPQWTDAVISNIDQDQDAVKAMLLAASKMRGVPPQMLELVAGLGEVWSAQTLAAYLKTTGAACEWIDARDVLIVPDGPLSGLGEKGTAMDNIEPFWDESKERLQRWWQSNMAEKEGTTPFVIITGFVCSTMSGRPTTLKRSGSDYSATIFAKILDASNVTFWKNVSGVYTADPRQVPEAFPINSMTFDEAMELAYFGGQVLHPSAMVPCIEERIPVLVKNVFDPAHPGTRVYGRGDAYLRWEDQDDEIDENMPVKAITSIEKVSLITIMGTSFMGTHGVAERFMEALASVSVNVILTSQGSSEHSISVAVANTDGKLALQAVEAAFQLEIARNTETRANLMEDLSILAVIGEGMKNYAGISGRFFNALGQSKVNIESNEGRDFSLPSMREVQYLSIDLRALCDENKMLCAQRGLPLAELEKRIQEDGTLDLEKIDGKELEVSAGKDFEVEESKSNLEAFVEFTESKEYPRKIIVDCTDSEAVASKYPEWLQRGFHIITPNRQVLAGPYEHYKECFKHVGHAGKFGGAQFRYDATVGGQIPVITLLQDLLQTGDRIESLTGVLSGTLSLAFNQLNMDPTMPFSEAYALASERQLTKTNSEEDLSGSDTAKKSLILARELGLTLELSDVKMESLLPDAVEGVEGQEVSSLLKEKVDGPMAERFREAKEKGELLFYVGRVDVQKGSITVGIQSFPAQNPPFALQDADMAVEVVSQRFPESTPLVFRGPGAGADFAASGLFASLLRVCRSLL